MHSIRRVALVLLAVALCLNLLGVHAVRAASTEVEEMAFGTGITDQGASTYKLLGKSSSFSTTTDTIWCFVRLTTHTKILNATFEWYTPEGDLYYSDVHGSLASGYIWSLRSAIHISGYKAALHPGTWTVKLELTPGRDPSATFVLEDSGESPPPSVAPSPVITPPTPTTPPTTRPDLSHNGEIWQLGDYKLAVVNSIKCEYAYGAAHVTLIVNGATGKEWIIVQDVQVDTGAFESMLPAGVITNLGVRLETGREIDFSGVTGSDVGWEHNVQIGVILLGGGEDVDGYILGTNRQPFLFTIPIIFYGKEDDSSASKLLGRSGVLSNLSLLFGERMLTITVRPD
jgi:hypothetical protein